MFKGFAAAFTAAATPWTSYLTSSQDISSRFLVLTAIVSGVAFVTTGAAYLSTSVASDKYTTK